MIASVEAIFLSTFILITQNRMAAAADRRAELDVQMSLLAEAEITKLVELVSEIARRMDVPAAEQEQLEEMKQQVAPEAVLDAIEEEEAQPAGGSLRRSGQLRCPGPLSPRNPRRASHAMHGRFLSLRAGRPYALRSHGADSSSGSIPLVPPSTRERRPHSAQILK